MTRASWKILASVRVNDYGYDVVRETSEGGTERYFTSRHIPGGTSGGSHSETEALGLLSDLSRLARDERS